MDIEFLTLPGLPTPFPQVTSAAVVAKSSDAPSCFRQIKKWITECDADHADCRSIPATPLPTRVIDVNPAPDGHLLPVLLESKGMSPNTPL